jgi:hypothetical protein
MEVRKTLDSYDPRKHGISYSTISDFLECRQRARFRADRVQSKIPSYPLTFGIIGHHVLKTAHVGIATGEITKIPGRKRVAKWVQLAETEWKKQNREASPKSLETLDLACAIAEITMPEYFKYWKKSLFEMAWDDKLTERMHKVPFQVSGYTEIVLNVVMDSSYYLRRIKNGKRFRSLWLFETKTSSRIVEGDLIDTIPIGLQHSIYMIAIEHLYGRLPRGVLYNFIRRSSVHRRKEEPSREYAERVLEHIQKDPSHYFIRIEMVTDRDEVAKARGELQGIINEYIKWYEGKVIPYRSTNACINKYGRCPYLPICSNDDYTFFTGGPTSAKTIRSRK